ncbi:MAG: NAD(P)H-dependent oxidoreductase [Methanomicrobiales archaeon]|nr:NAD(P)H-dependent oxidoreductase [Methanomicrobiales archaeon]
MTGKTALLLIGSPRGLKSSSASLGMYLVGRLEKQGFQGKDLHVQPLARSAEGLQRLASEVNASDVVIFAAPLYIDSIPAPLIAAMEHIYENRTAAKPLKNPLMVALVNSGFPEPAQSATALAIYQKFATEAGFTWAGGLAYASGQAAIDSRPLEKIGFMARKVRRSLDLAATALAAGKPIPEEARAIAARPIIPVWMFLPVGNLLWWRSRVKDKKVWKGMRARPFQGKG